MKERFIPVHIKRPVLTCAACESLAVIAKLRLIVLVPFSESHDDGSKVGSGTTDLQHLIFQSNIGIVLFRVSKNTVEWQSYFTNFRIERSGA